MPERYGPPTTCYNRFVRWRKAGVWDRLLEAVSEARWRHRHDRLNLCPRSPARGHGKKGDGDDGGMGRSRGGLTSKIHALVDAEGRPVNLRLTGGQIADCTEADALTDELGEGDILLADKGYDSNAIRAKAAERKAWANILPKTNRKGSFIFSRWIYRQRNLVERFFNRIKQFRGIATRYDKHPGNYPAAVKLVAARIWCQNL
ncbi:IS5 family transposase [Sinorhizobium meliloti]|uniref:IS5 family transposase n=2 Tax=Rhizobium meliloti TaxID=382 RepID=UPI001F48DAAC|nr:IS5 family transposase [Sinorhizobium meliloti]